MKTHIKTKAERELEKHPKYSQRKIGSTIKSLPAKLTGLFLYAAGSAIPISIARDYLIIAPQYMANPNTHCPPPANAIHITYTAAASKILGPERMSWDLLSEEENAARFKKMTEELPDLVIDCYGYRNIYTMSVMLMDRQARERNQTPQP